MACSAFKLQPALHFRSNAAPLLAMRNLLLASQGDQSLLNIIWAFTKTCNTVFLTAAALRICEVAQDEFNVQPDVMMQGEPSPPQKWSWTLKWVHQQGRTGFGFAFSVGWGVWGCWVVFCLVGFGFFCYQQIQKIVNFSQVLFKQTCPERRA